MSVSLQESPGIGHNRPPGPIDGARSIYTTLAAFLKDTPVISSEGDAKKGANLIEQVRRTLAEMEDERKAKVRPLNDEVAEINDTYRKPRESLDRLLGELKSRLTAFARAEEDRREREAAEKRRIAEEAAALAAEAARIEQEAKDNASVGEVVDIGRTIDETDEFFSEAKKTERAASRAEREVPVRLSTGFGRAMSMRTKETLIVDHAATAIEAMGLTDGIRDAILSCARAYRKLNKTLPPGISATTEREI